MHKTTTSLFIALLAVTAVTFAEKPKKITLVPVAKETFAFINTQGLVEICPEYAIDDSLNVSFLETFTSDGGSVNFYWSDLACITVKKGTNPIKYALIDRSGRRIAEGDWITNMISGLNSFENGYIGKVVESGTTYEYQLLNRDQKIVHAISYDIKAARADDITLYGIYRMANDLPFIAFRDTNAQWGLIDQEGKPLLAPSFDDITLFAGIPDRFVALKGNMTSVYSLDGKKIKDLGKGITVGDSEGLLPFRTKSEKEGLYTRDFSVAVKPTYEYLSLQSEGIREYTKKVRKEELIGLMDESGREITQPIYSYVNSFENGYASVRLNGRYLTIDKTGATVFDYSTLGITEVGPFNGGYTYAKTSKGYGFVDIKGEPLTLPPIALETVINALKNSASGSDPIVDNYLEMILNPFRFTRWAYFSKGLAYIPLHQFFFAIDENKRVQFIIPVY